MGIRKKIPARYAYSLIPQFAFLGILIYLSLCLWLKIHTIYNYAFWMDGQIFHGSNYALYCWECLIHNSMEHGSKLYAFRWKFMLTISILSKSWCIHQTQFTKDGIFSYSVRNPDMTAYSNMLLLLVFSSLCKYCLVC